LYAGVSGLQGADRGPRAHLGRGCKPVGRANFLAPRSVILSLYSAVDGGPPGGAGAGDPGAPTINVKMSTAGPQEVPEMEIQEHP
jgi:hypothetical protein